MYTDELFVDNEADIKLISKIGPLSSSLKNGWEELVIPVLKTHP